MDLDAFFQESYQRWWFGGIVFPLLFGITIGTILSIYTNWFTSRLMLYRQEVQRAQELTLAFVETFRAAILQTDEVTAEASFQWILLLPAMSLQKWQQQYIAGWKILQMGKILEAGAMRSWRRLNENRQVFTGTRVLDDEMEMLLGAVTDTIDRLQRIKPDYWRMAGLPTFGKFWRAGRYRYLRMRVCGRRANRYINDTDGG